MIDSLQKNLAVARKLQTKEQLGLTGRDYALLTLHRPSNVDLRESFEPILSAL